ncbi:MAG: bifunctional diaminohydroxyphosphoribosylaminopyrimidine deaminase/5-amino-6-(5-phosphoribosylamino)uracil reductase RibD [Elusimicrobia bacterium]|nr:bifunctional diaminohydroxyphosphoribosylaminopyrimidine deaminase/5-amino-6-(5-phosphoribosylamino)uracil reductase RibD [Elusimicrobiota bacterium]
MTLKDIFFMQRALSLAKKGLYGSHPNPMVGAVIVKNGKIIGEGFHKEFGKEHAEINAIKNAKSSVKGARIYVTLEPCSTIGKTPPCADALIKTGIKEVIIGANDPNPANSGKAAEILGTAGIRVRAGVLKKECESLNRVFAKHMRTGMPYVTLKISQSLDGKIADFAGNSRWISSKSSRIEAHKLRAQSDAVCVGIDTILRDNPRLNVRYLKVKKQPSVVVLDSSLRIPLNSNVFKNKNVVIAAGRGVSPYKKKRIEKMNAVVLELPQSSNGGIDIKSLLKTLGRMGIAHLMVEGGGRVMGSFISGNLWDRFICFISNVIIGGEKSVSSVVWPDAINEKIKTLGMKVRISGLKKIGTDLKYVLRNN